MKKILLITHSANITGGAEDDFQRIISYLCDTKKYSIHILCPHGYRYEVYSESADEIYDYRMGWFPVVKTNVKAYFRYAISGLAQIVEIRKKIGDTKYDVVVVNVSVLLFPQLYFWVKRMKSVVFIRETITPVMLRKYYLKILAKISNYFIGVSEFNANDYISITSKSNVDMLYSSIENETERIIDSEFDFKVNLSEKIVSELYNNLNFKILLNGNICERKNQLLALRSLDYIVNRLNVHDVKFFFVGDTDSDQKYYDILKDYVTLKKLNKYVYFLGALKKTTIYKIYESIQLTIITSLSEGLPLVLVESLAYKKPVISTNVGGIKEILIDGVNGFLLEDFEYITLSNAILKMKNNKHEYDAMSISSYETYIKSFDLKSNLNKFEKILDSVATLVI